MTVTKKAVIEKLQAAEADIRRRSYSPALTLIGQARQMVGELREPAPPPPVEPPAPTPEPEPTPEPPTPTGKLIFSARKRADFPEHVEGHAGAITDVADPLGQIQGTVIKLDTRASDIAPRTPTENPRAECLTRNILEPGGEYWLHTRFMVPSSFPSVPKWLTLLSLYVADGPGAPAPWHLQINGGSQLDWERIATYGWDVPFSMGLPKGRWVDVLHHTLLSEQGWVETWIDGVPITFSVKGYTGTRLAMKTIDKTSNPGPNYAKICNYRASGMYDQGPIYFTGLDVGTTRAIVGG